MSNEITSEVLSKAIDTTKETVQKKHPGDEIKLNIDGEQKGYYIIHSSASGKGNQLNALAIAPIVNGKPDYNNVAIVYAGTNTTILEGSGFPSAGSAFFGNTSGEYNLAVIFLKETQTEVLKYSGNITDVAGFSQSGGYMMKMAAEYGQMNGFKTTSFDDWGRNQFDTLTESEQQWLLQNPELLWRYQNESWAGWSGRDSDFGTIMSLTGYKDHDTLAKYFDGDILNLDRLANDGFFAPHMTKEQVKEAAKNWGRLNNKDSKAIENKIDNYLKEYGSYATGSYHSDLARLKQLKETFKSSGGGISKNEQIYLDSSQALATVNLVATLFEQNMESTIKIYQDGITELAKLWQTTLSKAQKVSPDLDYGEVMSALNAVGCSNETISIQPSEVFEDKNNIARRQQGKFDSLAKNISQSINCLVQNDKEIANQLRA